MAHIIMTYRSEQLEKDTDIHIHLPEGIKKGEKFPVLYLLHGIGGTAASWDKYSSVGQYVRNKKLIVVIPDGGKSFYMDEAYGEKYYSYIAKELPDMIEATFPASDERYIAGLSMGGYGAFRIALMEPERYTYAASFSGAVDIEPLLPYDHERFMAITGGHFVPEEMDLFVLAKKAESVAVKPKLYQWCGTEDFLYEGNVKFKEYMEKTTFDYTYAEGPGDHNWQYWDKQIEIFLGFIGF